MKRMKEMKPMKRTGFFENLKTLFFMSFISFISFMSPQTEVLVRLETPFGNIDLAIDTARAPITSANFLKYVDAGLYDGGGFHRVTRPDNYTPAPPDRPAMEIIQAQMNPGRRSEQFPAIALERTSVTGIKHVAGVVSMARGAPDTARSDFFILLDDQPSLDFGGKRFDDGQGGAAFGRVVAGMDVVRKIQQQEPLQDPPRQQYLKTPVPIGKAFRLSK
jgi:peptidyl-prolyl cis-trans isomerase A (cyclophilin A)